MATSSPQQDSTLDAALSELAELRGFEGAPTQFWPVFLAAAAKLATATRGLLILQDSTQPERLKQLSEWTAEGHAPRSTVAFNRAINDLIAECLQSQSALRELENGAVSGTKAFGLAVSLSLPGTADLCVATFLLPNAVPSDAREALTRLRLCADVPASYQQHREMIQARSDVEKFASVLDVVSVINVEKRFLAAALAFCNGLASRYKCERTSLGWLERGYVRLKAISRTERFTKSMAAVQALEVVMEEAYDQDEEVLWPASEGNTVIARDHDTYAREQAATHLCSVPLRQEGKPIAVLTCERASKPFTQLEVQQLRLTCDQAVARLADLKKSDRWFGARWTTACREKLAKLIGPEHTWAKVGGIAGAAALVALCLPIYPYRVEGNFILRSDEVAFLTAPYDGYIGEATLRPGDVVRSNAPLLKLDTDDLELEEASAIADHTRYAREAEKARAEAERSPVLRQASLADMRVNEALVAQAKARLDLVRHRLDQASLKSPFDAVVVEGDLRQRIGAAVKQGDPLFKVARLDTLYVEAEIPERDIHEIGESSSAEIAFVSEPKLKFPVKIERIEPAAVPKEGKNVFLLRCSFTEGVQPWWRPGMSGLCKVNVEKRTLLWIITHRTVDFLRMWLWW